MRALLLTLLLLLTACGPAPVEAPPPLQAAPVPEAPPNPDPPPEPLPGPEDFVLVTDFIPDISVDLRYAGEDNFTGQVIYDFQDPYLRYGTVQRLSQAQELLTEEGYSLLIWDAFRPPAAQFRLWEICPDPVYVANPQRGFSSHSRGNTVDVTLVSLEGEPLEMPTGFDDFTPLADRDYSDVTSPTAVSNVRLLEQVMEECGFLPYAGEWWHFTDTDDYPVEEQFLPGERK